MRGDAMNESSEKVRENRIRRMAQRQGLALSKSRRRDPRAIDYGDLYLQRLDAPTPERSNDAWIGPFRDLDEVERWLDTDPEKRPYKPVEIEDWRGR
jgi:hypothetical protein